RRPDAGPLAGGRRGELWKAGREGAAGEAEEASPAPKPNPQPLPSPRIQRGIIPATVSPTAMTMVNSTPSIDRGRLCGGRGGTAREVIAKRVRMATLITKAIPASRRMRSVLAATPG